MEALEDTQSNVCSVYSSKYVTNVYPTLERLKAGNAVFSFPVTPVKCAGAAQKICFLTEELVSQVSEHVHSEACKLNQCKLSLGKLGLHRLGRVNSVGTYVHGRKLGQRQ